ncbi:MAG: hypothetical protein WBP45_02965, partial [Daejeonella sp.]
MIFDFQAYVYELKSKIDKRETIERFELIHGVITGNIEDQNWYKNYASLFSLYYKPFKVPEELTEDFDWKIFFNLCCSSFSSNPQFIAPNKINYDENEELELE